MALSLDLRRRIVDLVGSGVSRREAARRFQVSASSAIRFTKQNAALGHIDVKKRKHRKSRLDSFSQDIMSWIAEQPDLTLQELSERLGAEHGLSVPLSTLDDWLRAKARRFQVSASSAIRFTKQNAALGHIDVKKRKHRKSRLDSFSQDIMSWIAEQPDLTLQELSERLGAEHGLSVPLSTLDDWLRANKISYKKNGARHGTGTP